MAKSKTADQGTAAVDEAVLPPVEIDSESDVVETPAAPVVDEVAPKATAEPEPAAKAPSRPATGLDKKIAAAKETVESRLEVLTATTGKVVENRAKLDQPRIDNEKKEKLRAERYSLLQRQVGEALAVVKAEQVVLGMASVAGPVEHKEAAHNVLIATQFHAECADTFAGFVRQQLQEHVDAAMQMRRDAKRYYNDLPG